MPRAGEKVIKRARTLRATPTDAEKAPWRILTQPPFNRWHFRRQHPIPPYFADVACVRAHLIIDVDRGQHDNSAHDARRDAFLASKGWKILRFWNNDVLTNVEGVATVILAALGGPHPNPPPDELGEGE